MSDKMINKTVKRFMNKRPFKQVNSFEEADLLLIFEPNNLKKFGVMIKKDYDVDRVNSLHNNFKIYYFKSTNPRDNKLSSIGFMKHMCNK